MIVVLPTFTPVEETILATRVNDIGCFTLSANFLILLDGETSLLENLVAINLLRKYGRNDAVFFYNQAVEVDFYIPDEAVAIQVCYNLDNSDGTFDREISALLKLSNVLECKKLMVITRESTSLPAMFWMEEINQASFAYSI